MPGDRSTQAIVHRTVGPFGRATPSSCRDRSSRTSSRAGWTSTKGDDPWGCRRCPRRERPVRSPTSPPGTHRGAECRRAVEQFVLARRLRCCGRHPWDWPAGSASSAGVSAAANSRRTSPVTNRSWGLEQLRLRPSGQRVAHGEPHSISAESPAKRPHHKWRGGRAGRAAARVPHAACPPALAHGQPPKTAPVAGAISQWLRRQDRPPSAPQPARSSRCGSASPTSL